MRKNSISDLSDLFFIGIIVLFGCFFFIYKPLNENYEISEATVVKIEHLYPGTSSEKKLYFIVFPTENGDAFIEHKVGKGRKGIFTHNWKVGEKFTILYNKKHPNNFYSISIVLTFFLYFCACVFYFLLKILRRIKK